MHKLKLTQRGGIPGGWILEIVALQSDLLSRAGKGAEEGNNPVVGRVSYDTACLVMTLLGTPNPPSPWDSYDRMSTQARSCWLHVL